METWALIKSRQQLVALFLHVISWWNLWVLRFIPEMFFQQHLLNVRQQKKVNVRALNEPRKRKKFLLNHKARYEMRICYFRDLMSRCDRILRADWRSAMKGPRCELSTWLYDAHRTKVRSMLEWNDSREIEWQRIKVIKDNNITAWNPVYY